MKPGKAWAGTALLLMLLSRPGSAQTGELRMNAGLAQGIESGGLPTGLAANASFSFTVGGFSFGPEGLLVPGNERVYGLGGVARMRLSSRGLAPYLIGGLGGNYWRTDGLGTTGLFTGNLGAGVGFGPEKNVGVELRIYENLQRLAGGPGNWAFITLTGGIRIGW